MKLFLAIALCMICFAANSLIARAALLGGYIDPVSFSIIRIISGALILLPFIFMNKQPIGKNLRYNLGAASCLGLYVFCFSVSYLHLDTGFGALIMFATVQVTIFLVSLILGHRFSVRNYVGLLVCLSGLAVLFWPFSFDSDDYFFSAIMVVSGIAWGAYSLLGRKSKAANYDNALNFLLLVPVCMAILPFYESSASMQGMVLAVLSGAITSGLAYSLWYYISPKINVSMLAISQTSVPIIAAFMGVVILDELLEFKFIIALVCIITGIVIQNHKAQQNEQN